MRCPRACPHASQYKSPPSWRSLQTALRIPPSQRNVNERKYLYTFLENGDVPIDNDRAENSRRPFAIGRKTGFSATQPTEPKQVPHYIHLFQRLRRMDLTQRNIWRSCFQSQREQYYCLGMNKAEIEYNMIRYVYKNFKFKDNEWIWPCRDGGPLQGHIFFWGGCGGFDGYYTGWVVMENKVFKISK